jgi:TPR repeat protein
MPSSAAAAGLPDAAPAADGEGLGLLPAARTASFCCAGASVGGAEEAAGAAEAEGGEEGTGGHRRGNRGGRGGGKTGERGGLEQQAQLQAQQQEQPQQMQQQQQQWPLRAAESGKGGSVATANGNSTAAGIPLPAAGPVFRQSPFKLIQEKNTCTIWYPDALVKRLMGERGANVRLIKAQPKEADLHVFNNTDEGQMHMMGHVLYRRIYVGAKGSDHKKLRRPNDLIWGKVRAALLRALQNGIAAERARADAASGISADASETARPPPRPPPASSPPVSEGNWKAEADKNQLAQPQQPQQQPHGRDATASAASAAAKKAVQREETEARQLREALEASEREECTECPLCAKVLPTQVEFFAHYQQVHEDGEVNVEGGEGGGAGAGSSLEEAAVLAMVRELQAQEEAQSEAAIEASNCEAEAAALRHAQQAQGGLSNEPSGQAAEHSHADAQYNLGVCYATGKGVEKDEAKAAQLYGQAAKQSHIGALYSLGLCNTHGKGVEKDEAKAARLYEQAALQGDAGAALQGDAGGQYRLGICYALGKGTPADKAQAARLFWQAAEQDITDAWWWLGWCSEHGQGTEQDASAAVEHYRLAVAGGCAIAIASLGLCFEKGRGVTRSDPVEAARLYALAAEGGASGEKAFDEAMAVLPDQRLVSDALPTAALARTRRAVYSLNLAARLGHVTATQQLETLAGRRSVVSACCVGCGAVRKLKLCNKCRVARFCDVECTVRMRPAHKTS